MLRNKALAQLQKTYDDSYLSCSTAVYYESQGNEDDAMRCWRNALDQISNHQTSRTLSSYTPRSETENALVGSLRELELQCKERIDLLQALRISRQENGGAESPGKSEGSPSRGSIKEKGWIGQGTIPATTYPELSRPSLPRRPSLPNRMPPEIAVVSSKTTVDLDQLQMPQPPSIAANMEKTLRSPSPEKHTMRTTLRNTKSSDKTKARHQQARTPEGPGASKAATIAWSALSVKDRLLRGLAADTALPAPSPNPEPPVDQRRASSSSSHLQWDSHTRRLVGSRDAESLISSEPARERRSQEGAYPQPSLLSISAASSALNAVSAPDLGMVENNISRSERPSWQGASPQLTQPSRTTKQAESNTFSTPAADGDRPESTPQRLVRRKSVEGKLRAPSLSTADSVPRPDPGAKVCRHPIAAPNSPPVPCSADGTPGHEHIPSGKERGGSQKEVIAAASLRGTSSEGSLERRPLESLDSWQQRRMAVLKNLPPGVDGGAAKQIFNEIVIRGDEVHWSDVAGLEIAKNALRETVVYPFLRPDLFMGLREPARGMLLFGPPGTGKTMLARAVATESKSTFFSISASSLVTKYLGDSEKLVRALFGLAKAMAPSIIFVDEIDSLLSHRSGSSEHDATRRIKTEFLIQWSNLQRAAAGRESSDKERGDATRVLVLAATNLPWAIDEAARRRFVRRQYIPLPEPQTRATQLRTLLGEQKHTLSDADIEQLVKLTDGFSGSDITALAKDAAMGPLRSLGDALLQMSMDDIRPIELADFRASLATIRPSVSKAGLKEHEDWAREFGERGG